MPSYTMYIHGTGSSGTGGTRTSNYTGTPAITATVNVGTVTRSGSTVKVPVTVTVGSCTGSHYFGYTMKVYAQLSNGSRSGAIINKSASPSQWSSGKYSGSTTLSETNTSTSTTLSIYLNSNCTCSQKNTTAQIWYVTVTLPSASYTVTYYPNGGKWSDGSSSSYKTSTVTSGNSVTAPGVSRSGYTLKNWNTNSGGTGTSYSSTFTPTSNISLYAQWTAVNRTITYNANGGSGAPSSATVLNSSSYTISSTKPTGQTYTISFDANGGTASPDTKTVQQTFKNWNTAANGSGTSYSSGATISSVTSDITLYAQYTNPTAGNLPTAERYNDITEEIDTSSSWSTSKTGGSGTYIYSDTVITGNTVVYAQYGIYITYYYNTDAFDEETSGEVTVMQYVNSTYAIIVYSGWSIDIPEELDGKYVITEDSSGNKTYTFTFDEEDEYVVTIYNAIGEVDTIYDFIIVDSDDDLEHWGDLGVFEVDEKAYGETYTIMSDYPIVPKLAFDHWNTQSNDNGTTYKAGDKYSKDESLDLYAQYVPGKYTVTFDANGGKFSDGSTKKVYNNVEAGSGVTPPEDPTRSQHSFLGWMGNYWEVTQDTTIKAMWNYYPIWIQNSKHEWEGFK